MVSVYLAKFSFFGFYIFLLSLIETYAASNRRHFESVTSATWSSWRSGSTTHTWRSTTRVSPATSAISRLQVGFRKTWYSLITALHLTVLLGTVLLRILIIFEQWTARWLQYEENKCRLSLFPVELWLLFLCKIEVMCYWRRLCMCKNKSYCSWKPDCYRTDPNCFVWNTDLIVLIIHASFVGICSLCHHRYFSYSTYRYHTEGTESTGAFKKKVVWYRTGRFRRCIHSKRIIYELYRS